MGKPSLRVSKPGTPSCRRGAAPGAVPSGSRQGPPGPVTAGPRQDPRGAGAGRASPSAASSPVTTGKAEKNHVKFRMAFITRGPKPAQGSPRLHLTAPDGRQAPLGTGSDAPPSPPQQRREAVARSTG